MKSLIRRALGFPRRTVSGPRNARDAWKEPFEELDFESTLATLRTKIEKNQHYRYFYHYFYRRAPALLREHRAYYAQSRRGYGEDAFHAMWWFIFKEERPSQCLEIGVYRGQVISLWTLLMRELGIDGSVTGISPLASIGDSVSSKYLDLDYEADILKHFAAFSLTPPELVRALSTEAEAITRIHSKKWDLIYIDGSHDEQVVLSDFENSLSALRPGGILVLDDAGLYFESGAPEFAFKGHPGPSRVAKELVAKAMEFVVAVGHNIVFRKRIEASL